MSKHKSDLSEFKQLLGDESKLKMKMIRPLSKIGTDLGKCLIKSIDRAGVSKNVLIRENVRIDKSKTTWIFLPFLTEKYQHKGRKKLKLNHITWDKKALVAPKEDIETLELLTTKLTDLFQRDLGLSRDLNVTNESWFKKQSVIDEFRNELKELKQQLKKGNGGN